MLQLDFHYTVTSPLFLLALGLVDVLDDLVDHARVRQGGRVAKLVLLACQDLAENAAHDLAGTRLRQVRHAVDGLGRGERPNALPDLHNEVFPEGVVKLVAFLDGDEGIDGLAGELVLNTDDRCLADGIVLNERRLDFSSGETVSGNVDNVIHTTTNPVVALSVLGCAITGEV